MCCIHGICILTPGANVSANISFHPVMCGVVIFSFKLEASLQPLVGPLFNVLRHFREKATFINVSSQ